MKLPILLKNKLDNEIQSWLFNYPILHPIYSEAISKLEFFLKEKKEISNSCRKLLDLIDKYGDYIINVIKFIYNNKGILDIIPSLEDKEFWRNEDEIEKLLHNLLNQETLSKQIQQICNRLREIYQSLAEYRICQILSASSMIFKSDKDLSNSKKKVDFLIELNKCTLALEVKAPVCFQETGICLKKTIESMLKALQAEALGSSSYDLQCYYDDRNPFFYKRNNFYPDYYNSNEMIFEVLLKKISRQLGKRQLENINANCKLIVVFLDIFTFKHSFNQEVLKEFHFGGNLENGILYYLVFGKKGDSIKEISIHGEVRDFKLRENGLKYSYPYLDGIIFHYSSGNYPSFSEYFVFYLLNSKCEKCINFFQNSLSIPISLSNKDTFSLTPMEFVLSIMNIMEESI